MAEELSLEALRDEIDKIDEVIVRLLDSRARCAYAIGRVKRATGLAIYKPIQLAWLTSLFGGYEWARWIHFWLTMGYIAFFGIHIAQVVRAGWPNLRAMISGYDLAGEQNLADSNSPSGVDSHVA